MNILLCHNHYQIRAGECLVVETEAAQLRARGHRVVMYTRDNAEIRSLSTAGRAKAFVEAFDNSRTTAKINELIDRERPDVAHVHNVFPLISPSVYRALKRRGVPVVQTIHNFRFMCLNGLLFTHGERCRRCVNHTFWPGIWRRCFRGSAAYSAWYAGIIGHNRRVLFDCIDRYIALNTFTRDIFINAGFDAGRIVVKPNAAGVAGVETSDAPARQVVFAGRLSREKGVMTLLDAAARVPGLPVRIIGGGPLEPLVRRTITERGLAHVSLEGTVPPDECARRTAAALALVFPSECYENCPLAVINALALGTPVVASNVGGMADFVPEGRAGWLVPPGDAAALAQRLSWIAGHEEDAVAMRPAVRAWGASAFSPERNTDALLAVYAGIDPLRNRSNAAGT